MCIRDSINIPVRHNEPESIDNIRGALHYLAKEEQKDGLCAYGCSEVPERPAAAVSYTHLSCWRSRDDSPLLSRSMVSRC